MGASGRRLQQAKRDLPGISLQDAQPTRTLWERGRARMWQAESYRCLTPWQTRLATILCAVETRAAYGKSLSHFQALGSFGPSGKRMRAHAAKGKSLHSFEDSCFLESMRETLHGIDEAAERSRRVASALVLRGMTRKGLATAIGYRPGYIFNVISGSLPARHCRPAWRKIEAYLGQVFGSADFLPQDRTPSKRVRANHRN